MKHKGEIINYYSVDNLNLETRLSTIQGKQALLKNACRQYEQMFKVNKLKTAPPIVEMFMLKNRADVLLIIANMQSCNQ
jgi:hypothetical protein